MRSKSALTDALYDQPPKYISSLPPASAAGAHHSLYMWLRHESLALTLCTAPSFTLGFRPATYALERASSVALTRAWRQLLALLDSSTGGVHLVHADLGRAQDQSPITVSHPQFDLAVGLVTIEDLTLGLVVPDIFRIDGDAGSGDLLILETE